MTLNTPSAQTAGWGEARVRGERRIHRLRRRGAAASADGGGAHELQASGVDQGDARARLKLFEAAEAAAAAAARRAAPAPAERSLHMPSMHPSCHSKVGH
jgi:hypothetical protein